MINSGNVKWSDYDRMYKCLREGKWKFYTRHSQKWKVIVC